jgi:hypothetical protein
MVISFDSSDDVEYSFSSTRSSAHHGRKSPNVAEVKHDSIRESFSRCRKSLENLLLKSTVQQAAHEQDEYKYRDSLDQANRTLRLEGTEETRMHELAVGSIKVA